MKTKPMLESQFYHDGRGPELKKAVWSHNGVVLVGYEYFNPDDVYEESSLKNIKLVGVQAYAMTSEEVHGNILSTHDSRAAIFEVEDSDWLASFNQVHLAACKHYQIMFYDEIYDVICKQIEAGTGRLNA